MKQRLNHLFTLAVAGLLAVSMAISALAADEASKANLAQQANNPIQPLTSNEGQKSKKS